MAALRDDHEIVRENAVDELDGVADASHLPVLVPLREDLSPHVRQAVETLIKSIGRF